MTTTDPGSEHDDDPADPDRMPDEASWALVRAFGRHGGLSTDGIAATTWAIDVLERVLGPSWPRRHFQKQGHLPGTLLGYSSHRNALPSLLRLALNLHTYENEDSFQPVLTNLRRADSASDWRHGQLQMEVARAGAESGAVARFEPAISGSPNKADVSLSQQDVTMLVETVSLRRAERDLAAEQFEQFEQFEQQLYDQILGIALSWNVNIDVRVRSTPQQQPTEWLTRLEERAERVSNDRRGVEVDDDWIQIRIAPALDRGAAAWADSLARPISRTGGAAWRKACSAKHGRPPAAPAYGSDSMRSTGCSHSPTGPSHSRAERMPSPRRFGVPLPT